MNCGSKLLDNLMEEHCGGDVIATRIIAITEYPEGGSRTMEGMDGDFAISKEFQEKTDFQCNTRLRESSFASLGMGLGVRKCDPTSRA